MSHAEHRSSELQLASSAASPAWVFIFCSKPQCHSQADASSGFSFSPQPGVVVQPHKVKRQRCPCIDQVLKSTCNLQQHERLQQHLHVQPVCVCVRVRACEREMCACVCVCVSGSSREPKNRIPNADFRGSAAEASRKARGRGPRPFPPVALS